MTLIEIFSILLIHWFADFVLQTDEQAKNKSTNTGYLLAHVSNYTVVWLICAVVYSSINTVIPGAVLLFTSVTFAAHFITDYFTSRLNSYLWKKGDTHNFFVSIGFDQVLHYVQLFTTFYLLAK